MKKNNLINLIIILLLFVGCAAKGPFFKPKESSKNIYLNSHPEIKEQIRQAIISGDIILGMSKDDVIVTWGKPDRIFPEGVPRFKYEPPPWNEQWFWKGNFLRTFSQDCTITFVENKVSNVQCDSVWK